MSSRTFLSKGSGARRMEPPNRPVDRSRGGTGDQPGRTLCRRDLRPRWAFAPHPAAALHAGASDGLRQGSAGRGGRAGTGGQRWPLFHPAPGLQSSGRTGGGERGRGVDGPGREFAPDRRPREGFFFSPRWASGHAHGHHARPERGAVAGNGRSLHPRGGDT